MGLKRENMKKLRSILCALLVFVAGAAMLSACSGDVNGFFQGNNQQQSNQIDNPITSPLMLAKSMILSGLSMDEINDNRNVLEKFGFFTVYGEGTYGENSTPSVVVNESVQYSNFKRVKSYSQAQLFGSISEEKYYNGGNKLYQWSSATETVEVFNLNGIGSYTDEMFENFFVDRAFDELYESVLIDYPKEGNVAISLQVKGEESINRLASIMDKGSVPAKTDVSDELRARCGLTVQVLFGNGQIEEVRFTFAFITEDENGDWIIETESYQVTNRYVQVQVPAWYTNYIAA